MTSQLYKTRPIFNSGYICERLCLGESWRNKIQATMNLTNRDNTENNEILRSMILSSHINASDDALLSFIIGIRMGIQIAEERTIQPIPPFKVNTNILERENG